jgi:phosphoglycerate kinase
MALQYINQADILDKRVIARFDFNVPLKDGEITDTTRIDSALPTINHILENGVKTLVLMSHLGRPDGKVDMDYSLEPVATYLAKKLGQEVILSESCVDRGIKTLQTLPQTKIILLQNLRFHPEEENGDIEFAKTLASYGDIYVNDAFGTCHRKHASTYQINHFFKNKSYGGLLIEQEIMALSKVVEKPAKPFIAIVGGAKVSDKIKIIKSLLITVNELIIGGAMAYPFLKAKGYQVGKSLCSDDDVALAKSLLKADSGNKIVLPLDHLTSLEFGGDPIVCDNINIPEDQMALDIGSNTIHNFTEKLRQGKTILWNGPMGTFEHKAYANGTFSIAKVLSQLESTFTLIGGGDSVAAINQSGLADKINHISTGGGASLEYIESGALPGIQALKFGLDLS